MKLLSLIPILKRIGCPSKDLKRMGELVYHIPKFQFDPMPAFDIDFMLTIDQVKPPFKECWFEYGFEEIANFTNLMLIKYTPEDKLIVLRELCIYKLDETKDEENVVICPFKGHINLSLPISDPDFFRIIKIEDHVMADVLEETIIKSIYSAYIYLLQKLNAKSSVREQRRLLVRKSPGALKTSCAYTKVNVFENEIRKSNEPLGGTHASPREHDRRGHMRTYHRGTNREFSVYVSETKVNANVEGKITHDYMVKKRAFVKGSQMTFNF